MKKDMLLLIAGLAGLYLLSQQIKGQKQPTILKPAYPGGYGDDPQMITDVIAQSDLPGGATITWL